MKLITETLQNINIIQEAAEGGKKSYFITGPFMVAEATNLNKRQYSFDVLNNATQKYINDYVKAGRAFGELGHPDSPSTNLDRVCLMTKSLVFEGNNCIGKAKILETPCGKIVQNLVDEGAKLGVSSRGMGSLKDVGGINMVQNDFMLSAVDVVADPSAPGAFVNGIMEGREWVWDNGIIKEMHIADYKKEITKSSKRDMEATKIKVFEHFLSKLKEL